MNMQTTNVPIEKSWFEKIPVALFPSAMGTAGLGLAWRKASSLFEIEAYLGEMIAGFSLLVFSYLLVAQLLRLVYARADLNREWSDPSSSSLFATITICGALGAVVLLPYNPVFAEMVWLPSVIMQLFIFLSLLGRWITAQTDINSVSLTWLFPITGNAVMVIAGVPLGYRDLSWFLLTITIIFWLAFLPLFLQKLMFAAQKIPPAAAPSFMILVSTPAIIAIALFTINEGPDITFTIATFSSLFFGIVAIWLWKWLFEAPFSRSWWAFTFPLAALSSALLRHYEHTKTYSALVLACIVLAIATFAVFTVWTLNIRALISSPKRSSLRRAGGVS